MAVVNRDTTKLEREIERMEDLGKVQHAEVIAQYHDKQLRRSLQHYYSITTTAG
jgi:hypothetical protein